MVVFGDDFWILCAEVIQPRLKASWFSRSPLCVPSYIQRLIMELITSVYFEIFQNICDIIPRFITNIA